MEQSPKDCPSYRAAVTKIASTCLHYEIYAEGVGARHNSRAGASTPFHGLQENKLSLINLDRLGFGEAKVISL